MPPARPGGGGDDDQLFSDVMRWLDEQPSRSVIYVELGSEAPVTAVHVRELALGPLVGASPHRRLARATPAVL